MYFAQPNKNNKIKNNKTNEEEGNCLIIKQRAPIKEKTSW